MSFSEIDLLGTASVGWVRSGRSPGIGSSQLHHSIPLLLRDCVHSHARHFHESHVLQNGVRTDGLKREVILELGNGLDFYNDKIFLLRVRPGIARDARGAHDRLVR